MILYFIIQCIYFMLPAYLANMAPVIAKNLHLAESLAVPVDFNKQWNYKPIFGSHKTFRGFIFGVLFALIIAYIQYTLYDFAFFRSLSLFEYTKFNWYTAGFLLGFGALFGDLVKSFFKRKLNVEPGQRFIPWDQIDYSVGAILFISLIFFINLYTIIFILIISFIGHILVNHISYYLGLRETNW